MAKSGRAFTIAAWVVVGLVVLPFGLLVVRTGAGLVTGTGKVQDRFAAGDETRIFVSGDDERSIYVRDEPAASAGCVTPDARATLTPRTGSDLTVDGTTWHRVYVLEASREGEYRVTCRGGAGFAVDRGPGTGKGFFVGVGLVLFFVVPAGWALVRRRRRPLPAPPGHTGSGGEHADSSGEHAGSGGEDTLTLLRRRQRELPRVSMWRARPFLKPPYGTKGEDDRPPCPVCGTPAEQVTIGPGTLTLSPCGHGMRVRNLPAPDGSPP
ncbi:hypothetical protein SMC26_30170 [Actinomadura fulvescens]